jgi:hypothetical protein
VELFCQSSRIQQDLEMSLECEDKFDIQVIVREWVWLPLSAYCKHVSTVLTSFSLLNRWISLFHVSLEVHHNKDMGEHVHAAG